MVRPPIGVILLMCGLISAFAPAAHAHYRPEIGRWLERDMATVTRTPNIYLHTHTNPITGIDSFGLDDEPNPCDGEPDALARCKCSMEHLLKDQEIQAIVAGIKSIGKCNEFDLGARLRGACIRTPNCSDGEDGKTIEICANENRKYRDFKEALLHELLHAFDRCTN